MVETVRGPPWLERLVTRRLLKITINELEYSFASVSATHPWYELLGKA